MHPTLLYRVWNTGWADTVIMPEQLARDMVSNFQYPYLRYAAVLKKVAHFTVALTIHGDHTHCRAALAAAQRRFNPKGE